MQYSDSKINPEYKQLSELPLNRFDYKGYYTLIHFDSEDKVLYGKIEGIDDLVTFESDSAKEIEKEFHDAVDDWLEFRKKLNNGRVVWYLMVGVI